MKNISKKNSQKVIKATNDAFDSLNVLINNPPYNFWGIFMNELDFVKKLEEDEELFDREYDKLGDFYNLHHLLTKSF